MKELPELAEWQTILNHHRTLASQSMSHWFAEDPNRANAFSIELGDIFLDYSKNRVTQETLALFNKLGHATGLTQKILNLFSGKPLNFTEERAVLHTALRNVTAEPVYVNSQNVMPNIMTTLAQMKQFSDQIRQQTWLGATGKPIQHIVNIGIGGSHLPNPK